MQRIQRRKKVRKKVPPQYPRRNTVARYFGKRANGNRQTGNSRGAWSRIGLSVLIKDLRPRYLLDSMLSRRDKSYNNIISIIDTDEKMLQAIEDLYLVMKAQPKYKNVKEAKWNESTPPIDVLRWILRKLGSLAKGEEWFIDTYQEGNKTRYRFVVWKGFSSLEMKHRKVYLPVDFLPFLKKKDEKLHDLIIDAIALVSKTNKIPLWDEDGDYSVHLQDWLENGSVIENFLMDSQLKIYRIGVAYEYLKLLKDRRRIVTKSDITTKMSAYDFKSDRLRQLCWWLKEALYLADCNDTIKDHSYTPNYIDGNPVTPYRKLKFIWSCHEIDIVHVKAQSSIDKDLDKYGYHHWPVSFTYANPGKKLPELVEKTFPVDLWNFMYTARTHFLYSFRYYYYKEMLADPSMTPGETLLTQFMYQEIKDLGRK